jgi:hypothetical protein
MTKPTTTATAKTKAIRMPGKERPAALALLTGPEPVANIHHVIAGELPDELTVDERDAVIAAIRLWEAQPQLRPN